MEKSILNFHFDYWNPSLIYTSWSSMCLAHGLGPSHHALLLIVKEYMASGRRWCCWSQSICCDYQQRYCAPLGLQLPVVVVVEALDLPLPAFVVRGQRCRWPRGRARTTAGAPSAQRGHLVLRWGHRPALNFLGGNLCPTSGGHLPSSRSQCWWWWWWWRTQRLFVSLGPGHGIASRVCWVYIQGVPKNPHHRQVLWGQICPWT